MNLFSLVFALALIAQAAVHLWLDGRQIRHVRHNRQRVPKAFETQIPLADHQKAADYTVTRTGFAQYELLLASVLLLIWTLGGGLDLLDRAWRHLGLPERATGVGVMLSALALTALFDLPAALYRTFVIEERFGFNRTTPKVFFSDRLKRALLLLALGIPLATLVLWLLQSPGGLGWLKVWVGWFGFSLLMTWAYPVLIAPLFNKFRPLDDFELRSRIEALLARNGFSSKGFFVMDGSLRSTHGNAYFTGFAKSKRIVFFDTLLKELEPSEVESVLAHELGHFKRRHVLKRIVLLAGLSLVGLACLAWLMEQPWFYLGLGISQPSAHTAIVLFFMVAPVFSVLLQPALAALSRRQEFEADNFAAEQADAGSLIRALAKLYRGNARTLTPDPLYSAFHDSHPPAALRVAQLAATIR
ncbi:MAG: M48 family metallopeptidase [Gammaproteobacteria bacterium]